MKNILWFFFLSAISFYSNAQITINGGDLPQPGESYIRANALGLFIDVSTTGPSTNWDYSDLEPMSVDTTQFAAVNQTPAIYQFSFNNPLTPAYQATDAIPSADLDLGIISLTNSYTYYKTASSQRNEVGRGVSFSGIPIPIKYDDIKSLLPLPLTYGSYLTDDFAYDLSLPNFIHIGQSGTLISEVDGWGTIYLPQDTFDVIRVRTETIAEDTVYLDTIGFGLTIPSTTVTYDWYAKEEGLPVLSITQNQLGITTGVSFKYTPEIPANVSDLSLSRIEVYPNPAKQQITINRINGAYKYELLSLEGKLITSKVATGSQVIQIEHLPKGIYLLRLSAENGMVTKRIVKQ